VVSVRIWHQSMTVLDDYGFYRETIARHARASVASDTEVVLHGLRPGTYGALAPAEVLKHPYPYHVILEQALENCYQAQQQGFDAVALASYSEPFLREARSLVDIPVASLAESTLLVGCSMARSIGLVTITPEVVRMTWDIIRKHRLEGRVSGVYTLDPPIDELGLSQAFRAPASFLSAFEHTAHQAIDEGADLILPAEGVFAELLWANGVRTIGEVSVMDSLGTLFMYTELLVNLRRRTGLAVGRRWEYSRPPAEVLQQVRATVNR
jgi:allantoin racemase